MEDIDRENFYNHLEDCKKSKNIKDVLTLIENIDDDDLQKVIMDKYKQFFEYNKNDNVDIDVLIMTLENTYLEFTKNANSRC